jgi:Bacterial transcriptional activator domain
MSWRSGGRPLSRAPIRAPQSVSRGVEQLLVRRLGSAQVERSAPPCISFARTRPAARRTAVAGVPRDEQSAVSRIAEDGPVRAGAAEAVLVGDGPRSHQSLQRTVSAPGRDHAAARGVARSLEFGLSAVGAPGAAQHHLVVSQGPGLVRQTTDVVSSVSTAGSLRITARRPAIRCTPTASAIVTMAGRPSGIAATATATATASVIAASAASATGQLIQALAASGRRAQALSHFTAVRRKLAEELVQILVRSSGSRKLGHQRYAFAPVVVLEAVLLRLWVHPHGLLQQLGKLHLQRRQSEPVLVTPSPAACWSPGSTMRLRVSYRSAALTSVNCWLGRPLQS